MRITNNMIMGNTKTNINSTKVLVDKYNTQMTTQKKISKASDDPVIAIRSLRLSTSLSHLDQYKDNNIPDASSWMDVTETALSNMKSLLTDIRTQCVNGSTDTLTAEDRNTILQQLTALSEQVYTEGNADYAGRTVFTGYRTSSKLTFQKNTKSTYQITQEFSAADLSEKRYYTNGVTVPNSINAATPDCTTDVTEHSFQRIRLGYGNTTDDVKLSIDGKELAQGTDYTVYKSVSDFDPSKLSADDMAYIQETGEFVFGKNVAASIKDNDKKMSVTYVKTGFDSSDARPEYYYNCKDITDAVTEGRVTIDGNDVRKLTLESLRSQIGLVSQDVYLFGGSIKDNIAYGKPDATMDEIVDAAKKANIHDFIMELPDKYDTFVGERGTRLSGGQKQRISIARVFLKNPPVLILDEATSALDNESERFIQRSLEELAKDRTTITIAHRLSTIRNADEILVVADCGIAERGTHEELLELDGIYARYYDMSR